MSKTTSQDIKATLWKAAGTFRGTIDAANYKDFVLSMLFLKYLDDTYTEFLRELERRHVMENCPLDCLGILHSLLLVEIGTADLVGHLFGISEICCRCRNDGLHCQCGEFGKLDEFLIQFRRDEGSLDLELEETVVEKVSDVSCLFEKAHHVRTGTHKGGLGVKRVLDLASEHSGIGVDCRHAHEVCIELIGV